MVWVQRRGLHAVAVPRMIGIESGLHSIGISHREVTCRKLLLLSYRTVSKRASFSMLASREKARILFGMEKGFVAKHTLHR